MPFWYSEFKKRWIYAEGWAHRKGKRPAVGIKTPRLIDSTQESMGENLFVKEKNFEQKVLSIVWHEITHAFSSHLRMPTWINECLAMVSVDGCLDQKTVMPDTLLLLKGSNKEITPED